MWCCRVGGACSRRPRSEMTPAAGRRTVRSRGGGCQAQTGTPHPERRTDAGSVPRSRGHPHTGCTHSSAQPPLAWHIRTPHPEAQPNPQHGATPHLPLGPLTSPCSSMPPLPTLLLLLITPGVGTGLAPQTGSRWRPPETGSLPSGPISRFLFAWEGHSRYTQMAHSSKLPAFLAKSSLPAVTWKAQCRVGQAHATA